MKLAPRDSYKMHYPRQDRTSVAVLNAAAEDGERAAHAWLCRDARTRGAATIAAPGCLVFLTKVIEIDDGEGRMGDR